jgi:hypothetical protein
MLATRWQGCYQDTWQDSIVPEAFCHPAKFSRGLIHRIYRHMLEQGYIKPGDTVLDPFGGVALGALDAMTYGLRYIGVELEPKFVELGNKNLELWRQRYGFTTGTLVQGDSRNLRDILLPYSGVQAVVGSPPYAESLYGTETTIDHARLERLEKAGYTQRRDHGFLRSQHSRTQSGDYGTTPGQLGAMPPGCVVSSPPWEYTPGGCCKGRDPQGVMDAALQNRHVATSPGGYGTSPAQLGNTAGDTFWSASAQIMQELALLLPAGAVCAWVVKAYVSKKAIVPFPDQWLALTRLCGFRLVEEIHASLVEDHGTQEGLFGEAEVIQTKRASFFRRLAEKKGSPRIDHETVLIVGKA